MVASLVCAAVLQQGGDTGCSNLSFLCPIPLYSLGFLDFGGWWLTTSGSSLSHNCHAYLQNSPARWMIKLLATLLLLFGTVMEIVCTHCVFW